MAQGLTCNSDYGIGLELQLQVADMNIHEPRFTSSQVALAAGMTGPNFRAYLRKGDWRILGGERGGSERERNGDAHLFTIFDALGYALARSLVAAGADPKVAFERAFYDWSHAGHCGEPIADPDAVFTVYCFSIHTGRGQVAKVTASGLALDALGFEFALQHQGTIIINLTAQRDFVFASLGLDARDFEDGGKHYRLRGGWVADLGSGGEPDTGELVDE